ncbi:hypothetical protein [Actinokineospora sp.]|uniref:hypothetical protein n=1 Tax=Actinokineospora sp. TaxID=1872133 RepID=UPI003D6B4D25
MPTIPLGRHQSDRAAPASRRHVTLLALRCADWVPQVRSRAREVVLRCPAESPKVAFEALAPVAFALVKRASGTWLAGVLDEHLRDGPPEVLAWALDSRDRAVRRAAYRVALGQLPIERLLRAVRSDDDIAIRVRCAEAVIRVGDPAITRALLSSRTAGVRADAVHAMGLAGETAAAEALGGLSRVAAIG